MQDLAHVADAEALVVGRPAQADPGDVALADVHDALGVVDQVVDLALEDGLEVGLHLAPGHLDEDAQGQAAALVAQVGRMSLPMT